MKKFSKKETSQLLEVIETDVITTQQDDDLFNQKSSVEDLEKVSATSNEIKQQSKPKSILRGTKNIRALAENDIVMSRTMKNILDWLLVVTTAETIRREEYEELTEQILEFDEDLNTQLEMQVKFKRIFEQMQKKNKQLLTMKYLLAASSVLSVVATIISVCAWNS